MANNRSTGALTDTRYLYRFGKDLDGNALLRRGWGEPERGFVWTEGKASVIVLPAQPGENILAISVWAYVSTSTHPQELLIFINGLFRGHFIIHEKTILHVSYDNNTGTENLEIVFYIPSAISPQVAEGSTDKRQLGVALATIQLGTDRTIV